MNSCTVLAVDDEVYNLETIERILHGKEGFFFLKTNDPKEALNIIRQETVHIIISDQRMPGMSGIDLLKRVFQVSPDTIRVVLTAYPDLQEVIEAVNLGHIYGYITKPYNPEDLFVFIQQARKYYELCTENKFLVEQLKQKNRQLEKSNEELKKLDELKNRFMLIASHELRTPATIITGSLELLSMQEEEFSEYQQNILRNALKGAFRLNEIIESFFTALRLEKDPDRLNKSHFDVQEMIQLLINRFEPHLKTRRLELQTRIEERLSLEADRGKLYLVFDNLLSNAIKYTPDGGKIVIGGYRKDQQVIIYFQDNGIGIPSEELERIFDTFYQLEDLKFHHSSRFEFLGGGAGLGLALCRRIVEAHRGRIWVESAGDGQGSTFFISLPRTTN